MGPTETKSFHLTSEFWITALTNAMTIGMLVAGSLPPKYAGPMVAVINGFYAVSRGIAKSGVPGPPA